MHEGRTSTVSLLCTPFLDTHSRKGILRANTELRDRGFPTPAIKLLQLACSPVILANAVLWDEWHLDFLDVLTGYGILFILLGVVLSMTAWVWMIFPVLSAPHVLIAAGTLVACGLLLLAGIFAWVRHSVHRMGRDQ